MKALGALLPTAVVDILQEQGPVVTDNNLATARLLSRFSALYSRLPEAQRKVGHPTH